MPAGGILHLIPLFARVLTPGAITELEAAAGRLAFRKRDILIRQGEPGQSMYVIAEGKVAVTVHAPGGPREVAVLGPRELVGEMSLLTGERRTATVTAISAGAALVIDKEALRAFLAAEPALADRFAEVVEQRHAELRALHDSAVRWHSVGLGRAEIAARTTAFYAG